MFEEWRVARKEATCDSEHCPEDLLSNPTAEALNRWIPKFIVEARKVDGSPYPPRSINQILAALQRHMRATSRCTKIFGQERLAFSLDS